MEGKIWKTAKRQIPGVGQATLIHRQDHPANGIIRALTEAADWSRPINFGMERSPGTVSVHPYGNRHIVVRWLNDGKWVRDIFRKVESARKRQAGFDEEHIAYIRPHGESKAALVTLALADEKHNIMPTMEDYFNDGQNSIKRLRQVAIRAVKKLAELHAGGFSHGHPSPENILVETPDTVRLIDPKAMNRLYAIRREAANKLRMKDHENLAEQILILLEKRGFTEEQNDAFSQRMDDEYDRHYKRCNGKKGKKT